MSSDHIHDHSHGPECGLKGYATYIRCQGFCGTLLPFPSPIEGERPYYCDACWEKHQGRELPSKAERQAGLEAIEHVKRVNRIPPTPPEEALYHPTDEELAWARAEIARQKAAIGLAEEA